MQFQSYIFIFLFLPLTLFGWWFLNGKGLKTVAHTFLLVASLFFYGYHDMRFVPILACSVLFNFFLGNAMARWHQKKLLLLLIGLVGNLGMLIYFKYTNFLIDNMNLIFQGGIEPLSILVPLGISFFTFQQIAYLVDGYRKKLPAYGILEYALFVSFFPYVISGPIAFHDEIIPQLRSSTQRKISAKMFSAGILSFSLGLAKKVLLAEVFGQAANWGFAAVGEINSTTAVLVVLSYTLQLYFDFSGYTDMARGIGNMLGIQIPQNFNAPYRALTIGQFWKGWHMTMTRFFTRYLYIPLGGSKMGAGRTYINIMVIFLVSGLWHGANWTFVVWGALHGLAMVMERLLGSRIERLHPVLS